MLRLPPVDDTTAPLEIHRAAPPIADVAHRWLRVEAGAGGRYENGLDSNVALRFAAAVSVQPWRDRGWRFGALADFGASAIVFQYGFRGHWNNAAALATASWSARNGVWEVGPWLAVGVERSLLFGTQDGASRTEEAYVLAVRGGVAAHRAVGAWTIGAMIGVETLPTTRTYTRPDGLQIFEIPAIGAIAEVVVGIDLAP
jgi:hypothetical protein